MKISRPPPKPSNRRPPPKGRGKETSVAEKKRVEGGGGDAPVPGPPPPRRSNPPAEEEEDKKQQKEELIMHGYMSKKGRSAFKSSWDKRWFDILRAYDDCYDLVYRKHREEEERGRIRITGSKIAALKSDLIEISTTSRILIVKCMDEDIRKEWAKALNFHAKAEAIPLEPGKVLKKGWLVKSGGRKRYFVLYASEYANTPKRLEYFRNMPAERKSPKDSMEASPPPNGCYNLRINENPEDSIVQTEGDEPLSFTVFLEEKAKNESKIVLQGDSWKIAKEWLDLIDPNYLPKIEAAKAQKMQKIKEAEEKRANEALEHLKQQRMREETAREKEALEHLKQQQVREEAERAAREEEAEKAAREEAELARQNSEEVKDSHASDNKVEDDNNVDRGSSSSSRFQSSNPMGANLAFAALAALKKKKKKSPGASIPNEKEIPKPEKSAELAAGVASAPPPPAPRRKLVRDTAPTTKERPGSKAKSPPRFKLRSKSPGKKPLAHSHGGSAPQFRLPSLKKKGEKPREGAKSMDGKEQASTEAANRPEAAKEMNKIGVGSTGAEASDTKTPGGFPSGTLERLNELQQQIIGESQQYMRLVRETKKLLVEKLGAQKTLRMICESAEIVNEEERKQASFKYPTSESFNDLFDELQREEIFFQGEVTKEGEKVKNWKKRWMVLTSSMVAYGGQGERPKQIFRLNNATVLPLRSIPGVKHPSIELKLPDYSREFHFFADGKEANTQWFAHIYNRTLTSRYRHQCKMLLQSPNVKILSHLDAPLGSPASPLVLNGRPLSFQLIEILIEIFKGVPVTMGGERIAISKGVTNFECVASGLSVGKVSLLLKAALKEVHGTLRSINLSENPIEDSPFAQKKLTEALEELKAEKPPRVSSLSLCSCKIGPSVAGILTKFIDEAQTRFEAMVDAEGERKAKLGSVEEGKGEISIPSVMPFTSIRLAQNPIGDEGLKVIAENLSPGGADRKSARRERITSLDLSKCNVGMDGIRFVEKLMVGVTGIKELNLNGNQFNDAGIEALCKAVQEHPALTALNVSEVPMTSKGARALTHLAQMNDRLTKLWFGPHQLDREGLSLMRFLFKAEMLRRLN